MLEAVEITDSTACQAVKVEVNEAVELLIAIKTTAELKAIEVVETLEAVKTL